MTREVVAGVAIVALGIVVLSSAMGLMMTRRPLAEALFMLWAAPLGIALVIFIMMAIAVTVRWLVGGQ